MVKRERRRPSTATLVKPTLLDTRLLGIFDMSTVSRDHLIAIKNLVHSTPRCACKPPPPLAPAAGRTLSPHQPPSADHGAAPKMYKVLNRTYRIRTNVRQRLQELAAAAEPAAEPWRPRVPVVPAPCVTCGRPEQPERFHSHPSRVETKAPAPPPPPAEQHAEKRKTVQKPVAMKFKSSKTKIVDAAAQPKRDGSTLPQPSPRAASNGGAKSPKMSAAPAPPPSSKSSPNKENVAVVAKPKMKLCARWRDAIKKNVQLKREPKEAPVEEPKERRACRAPRANAAASEGGYKLGTWNPAPVSGGRARKVVCYLCSQEFGTAALPSHEAQCIQKYLKETTDSDTSLRNDEAESERSAAETQENWKLAWEVAQASLIPCEFCVRKFLPARLEAHQKICGSKVNKESTKNKGPINANVSQPGILCENCDKRYGSSSIAIHREQCTKKAKIVDPPPPETQPPLRKASPPMTAVCYICGRNFGTKSIGFHEPQCLKKWKIENEKLPLELRQPAPVQLNESVCRDAENINSDSQELFWKAHQAQLVPCPKCARTFYPNRLEVHLKGCKGPSKNKGK